MGLDILSSWEMGCGKGGDSEEHEKLRPDDPEYSYSQENESHTGASGDGIGVSLVHFTQPGDTAVNPLHRVRPIRILHGHATLSTGFS